MMQIGGDSMGECEGSPAEARRVLRSLLRDQRLGVLSTHHARAPYASLVAFAASEDLRTILFATPRATRKFANIEAERRVAMLVHNAHGPAVDFEDAAAVTVTGTAQELIGDERTVASERFTAIHPHLAPFVASPSTALLSIQVESYFIVRRFQHVTELRFD